MVVQAGLIDPKNGKFRIFFPSRRLTFNTMCRFQGRDKTSNSATPRITLERERVALGGTQTHDTLHRFKSMMLFVTM